MLENNGCEFCELVKELDDEYFLGETKHWKIYLADEQNYPGRCIIPLKRHCPSLSKLTADEWQDFYNVVRVMEKVLIQDLGATNVNWTCLMNGGYAVTPPNPHSHFHLIPRYDRPQKILNQDFIDENFANHYKVGDEWRVSVEGRKELMKKLKPVVQQEIARLIK